MSGKPESRLQTASDPAKAFRMYDELRRTKRLKRAVIVAELENGSYRIMGQMAAPYEMAELLMVAAKALELVPADQRGIPEGEATVVDGSPLPPRMTGGKPVYSIAAGWSGFETAILGGAPAIQKREMRRAFYSGARELLQTIMAMLEPGEDPTDADLTKMDDLHAELERFLVDLREGRA